MAANQPARVRANIEDLHRDLIIAALTPKVENEPPENEAERRVAAWLLKIFAFNRSRWIRTEDPFRINGCIFSSPEDTNVHNADAFRAGLLADLGKARQQYKERWLWDLIMRGTLLGAITSTDATISAKVEARRLYDFLTRAEQAGKATDPVSLAKELLAHQSKDPAAGEVPQERHLNACKEMLTRALERDFFCFRLIPYARKGFESAPRKARELYVAWVDHFENDQAFKTFRYSCISCDSGEGSATSRREKARSTPQASNIAPVGRDGRPIAVNVVDAEPDFPYQAWLTLEVIEQRLPGEHGYRFFPSFYRHLDDTMSRIPLYAHGLPSGRSVLDNLKPTVFQGIGLSQDDLAEIVGPRDRDFADPVPDGCRQDTNGTVVELHRERPRSVEAFRDCTDRFVRRLGGSKKDAVLLLAKLIRFMTSSAERRRNEYEDTTWAEFVDVKKFSPSMKFQIESAAQALLAFSATEADARTYGNVAVQMLLDELRDGTRVDRTLNGPTSDAWLEPWREHLERQGVRFFRGKLTALEIRDSEMVPEVEFFTTKNMVSQDAHEILSADVAHEGLQPDFYVLALNIEQTRHLVAHIKVGDSDASRALHESVRQEMASKGSHREIVPDFIDLSLFGEAVDANKAMKTMTGLQYFFDAKTDIGRGHMYFPYSKWGLSSISQSEFWSVRGGFSDGYFGLLSVDVCTTGEPSTGTIGKPDDDISFLTALAPERDDGMDAQCERAFVTARTALAQIRGRVGGSETLGDPRCFHVDRNLFLTEEERTQFLASVAKMDTHRPGRRVPGSDKVVCVGPKEIEYHINCGRWVMCGTFMATHTRMTTMEAANESGRHAVAAILKRLCIDDASEIVTTDFRGHPYQIENLSNRTYNWASTFRTYEPPRTWNPEEQELEDMDFFRRVDRRLVKLGLPHFMDIMNFDRKLENALEAMDIYGEEKPLSQLFGASLASLDATLVKELGQGYSTREEARWKEATTLQSGPPFSDMTELSGRWKRLFDAFSR